MPTDDMKEFARLSDLLTPWAVRVAATLRLADLIAAGHTRIETLADKAGADPDALARLLRYLACRSVFAEPEPGVFALTGLARPLLGDHPANRRARLDLDGMGGRIDGAYAALLHSVRLGRPGYETVFGRPFWADIAANPQLTPSFDDIMADHTPWFTEVTEGYDWTGVRRVADIGGGSGALLAELLRAHPHLRAVLVDQAATVAAAERNLARHGVAERTEFVAGDFFAPLPPGADVYVLSNVLHDWSDADVLRILRRCAAAAGPAGRVLIADRVVDRNGDPRVLTMLDLRMLVLLGGRERTADEWSALITEAGLSIGTVIQRPGDVTLLDCVPDGASR
nr:o-methyltransferase [Amycolatopsis sp.]